MSVKVEPFEITGEFIPCTCRNAEMSRPDRIKERYKNEYDLYFDFVEEIYNKTMSYYERDSRFANTFNMTQLIDDFAKSINAVCTDFYKKNIVHATKERKNRLVGFLSTVKSCILPPYPYTQFRV